MTLKSLRKKVELVYQEKNITPNFYAGDCVVIDGNKGRLLVYHNLVLLCLDRGEVCEYKDLPLDEKEDIADFYKDSLGDDAEPEIIGLASGYLYYITDTKDGEKVKLFLAKTEEEALNALLAMAN
jgi:hypothetical protein